MKRGATGQSNLLPTTPTRKNASDARETSTTNASTAGGGSSRMSNSRPSRQNNSGRREGK